MKRLQLIALAASVALSSQAFDFKPQSIKSSAPVQADVPTLTAATDNGYNIQFCTALNSWYTAVQATNVNYRCYIYIPVEIANQLVGNTIETISFSAVLQSTSTRPGTIFVSEDINADPVTSTEVTVTSSPTSTPKAQTETLATPYTIKENQGFYFGYTVEKCGVKDYPIGCDASAPGAFNGNVDVTIGGQTTHLTGEEATSHNIFLAAGTVGDKRAINDLASLRSLSFDGFTTPTVAVGATPKIQFKITNIGDNKISSMDYAITLNGVEGETKTAGLSVYRLSSTTKKMDGPAVVEGKNIIGMRVKAINGAPCDLYKEIVCFAVNPDDAYTRNFFVEKGTGTWCGYCPIGIVGFETMQELYPDTFIPVDVHTGDNFEATTYAPMINQYFRSVPNAVINRDPLFASISPSAANLKNAYTKWQGNPSPAKIEIESVVPNDKSLTVTTNSAFLFDDDSGKYSIALIVTEDGLTGKQTNYYAGSSSAPGDWGKYADKVNWVYNHTARGIYDIYGMPGSVPTTVTKGQNYKFEYDVPLTGVKNADKTSVVAILIENYEGTVLNTAVVHAEQYVGVESVASDLNDTNAPAEYYNLQGIRVANPQPGQLVVKKQGSTATKVIF